MNVRRFLYDTTMMLFGGSLTILALRGFDWWWVVLAIISYIINVVIEFHHPKVKWG